MASIYKRGKTWTYRVNYYDDSHTRHSKTKGGYSTKREAEIAAREIETNKDKGFSIDNKNISFADYFKEWFDIYKKGKVVAGREQTYMAVYNNIKSYFKFKEFTSITRSDYQKFINHLSTKIQPSTVSMYNATIKTSISDALQEGIIYKDFTYKIEIKKEKSKQPEKALSVKDYLNLMNYLASNIDKSYNLAFYIAGMTGLRIGEVYGLNWEDVDLNNNEIAVNKIYDFAGKTYEDRTKTFTSTRKVPIGLNTRKVLSEIKTTGRILPPRHLANINRNFTSILKTLNIDTHFTPHKLRHTYASYLISEGIDISYVSKILGHANVAITLKIYQHVLEEKAQEEQKKLMKLM